MLTTKKLCCYKKKDIREDTNIKGEKNVFKDVMKEAEKILGGRTKFAELVGVSYKTASDWVNGRSGISTLNALKIEKLTNGKITRQEILPDHPWGN